MINYFEFYGLPMTLGLDESTIKQIYYSNSKNFHPDFFTLSDVEKQMEALEMSTQNNNAYKTLISFEKRLQHILEIKDALDEEGQNKMPQEFLMEMMEINEAVMELQFDFEEEVYSKLLTDIEKYKTELFSEITPIIPKKDHEISSDDLITMKEFYLKNKYLLRLEDNIKKLKP